MFAVIGAVTLIPMVLASSLAELEIKKGNLYKVANSGSGILEPFKENMLIRCIGVTRPTNTPGPRNAEAENDTLIEEQWQFTNGDTKICMRKGVENDLKLSALSINDISNCHGKLAEDMKRSFQNYLDHTEECKEFVKHLTFKIGDWIICNDRSGNKIFGSANKFKLNYVGKITGFSLYSKTGPGRGKKLGRPTYEIKFSHKLENDCLRKRKEGKEETQYIKFDNWDKFEKLTLTSQQESLLEKLTAPTSNKTDDREKSTISFGEQMRSGKYGRPTRRRLLPTTERLIREIRRAERV